MKRKGKQLQFCLTMKAVTIFIKEYTY